MKSKPEVKVIEDSINEDGHRITTMQLKYWRAIHAELMTHRVFSRNAASSRAIPISKLISRVWNHPSCPRFWGLNQAWMTADHEAKGIQLWFGLTAWKLASVFTCFFACLLNLLGFHKQIVNRLLEPFMYMDVIVTATEWKNFFELRIHPDAQPEMQDLAGAILHAMSKSTPKLLKSGEWHLPYITQLERSVMSKETLPTLLKCSAARCARVSTMNHDGSSPSITKDVNTYEKLVSSFPPHASPLEHQATPFKLVSEGFVYIDPTEIALCRNYVGWIQHRALVEDTKYLAPDYAKIEMYSTEHS